MIKKLKSGQEVDDSIRPLPFKQRKSLGLNIGYDYYVSFGNSFAYQCTLTKIINEFAETEVEIEIPLKLKSKNRYFNSKGQRVSYLVQTNTLYAKEIGATPEEAVKNQV